MLHKEHKNTILELIEEDFENIPVNKETLTAYITGIRKHHPVLLGHSGTYLLLRLLELFEQDFITKMIVDIAVEKTKESRK